MNPLVDHPFSNNSDGGHEPLAQYGFFTLDLENQTATASRTMSDWGFEGAFFLSDEFPRHIHPRDWPSYHDLLDRLTAGTDPEFLAEYRFRLHDKSWRWIQTFCWVVDTFPDGRARRILGLDRDISARKKMEGLQRRRQQELESRLTVSESLRMAGSVVSSELEIDRTVRLAFDQASTLFEFQGGRIWVNHHGGLSILGSDCQRETAGPDSQIWIHEISRHATPRVIDIPEVCSWIGLPLFFQGKTWGVLEFWHQRPGHFRGDTIWVALSYGESVTISLVNALRFEDTRQEIERDPLTGLGNRRCLDLRGPELIRECLAAGRDLALVLMDIDHFKTLNDTWGHQEGDAMLRCLADSARGLLRKDDLFCRFGGDEFIGLFPDTDLDGGRQVSLRLSALFQEARPRPDGQPVTLSMGLTSLGTRPAQNIDQLIEAADKALYGIKTSGRNALGIATT